ncbi:MAG: 50S ribosomal protein L18 [Weeksellaceae bacterium]
MNISNRINRRKKRVSSNLHGTAARPRIVIYRSNKSIYAQAVDDDAARTLAAYNSLQVKTEKKTKSETAREVGKKLAEILKQQGVTAAIFDRSRYGYKGRVQQVADGVREIGITM